MYYFLNYLFITVVLDACVIFTIVVSFQNNMVNPAPTLKLNTYEELLTVYGSKEESENYKLNDDQIGMNFTIFIREHVSFWLYTRERSDVAIELVPDNLDTLMMSDFDEDNPTKILVHGWLGNNKDEDSLCSLFKSEYFIFGNYNLICVDWSLIAIDWTYIAARLRCKEIGNYIAELILMLTNNTYQEMDNIHILGFSMGAHIAGYAGKRLDGQLMRITGLDPAKPLFFSRRPNERLDGNDAKFVDIVHTTELLGQHKPIGNIDFYPNGAENLQPGCNNTYNYVGGEICSHYKSYVFYIRSIRSKDEFKSINCDKWNDYERSLCDDSGNFTFMGEHVDFSFSGNFYLTVT